MIGTLPNSLGNLTQLQLLHLTFNDLQGTIPHVVGDLTQLKVLELFQNNLNGAIPSMKELHSLTTLALGSNNLSGTIPEEIGNTALIALLHGNNYLTGSIPKSIEELTEIEQIFLGYNFLTSTIPNDIGNLIGLQALTLTDNKFNGTIPHSLVNLTHIKTLSVSYNHLTGTVPDIFINMHDLAVFDINKNYLHGTISQSLWNTSIVEVLMQDNLLSGPVLDTIGYATMLRFINISSNIITGTIPQAIGSLYQLDYFSAMKNRLRGTLPRTIGKLGTLTGLFLRDNRLTGTVPATFQNLSNLVALNLQDNKLTGPLAHIVNPSQYNLLDIQLNGNAFTGELPAVFFQLPYLSSLGISSACLHGTFPDNICEATELITLVLYGLSTGTTCTSSRSFEGTLPRCLLTLPKIRTLLMSSNRLSNTMSDDWVVNNKTLIQLDLCHNQLRGVIPSAIQNHSWSLLDLSNNKFSGELSKRLDRTPVRNLTHLFQFESLINTTTLRKDLKPRLTLEVNRLSGKLPNSIKQMTDLTVLAGNLFQCRYDKTDLPQHDSDLETYECASNSFNLSIYLWLGLTVAVAFLLYVYWRTYHSNGTMTWSIQIPELWKTQMPHLCSVLSVYSDIYKVAGYCTAFCLLVLLPYYLLISHYSGTHTHQYAYAVSAIYTNGRTAFALTMVLLALLLCISYVYIQRVQTSEVEHAEKDDYATVVALRYVSVLYSSANVVVVLGINIAFVFIVLYESSVAQTVAQVALSIFKLVWSMEVSPYMMRKLDAYYLPDTHEQSNNHRHNYFTLQLLVALFNNIAIPCLVVMAIDPNCFSALLSPPESETVEYLFTTCSFFRTASECLKEYRVESFRFTPPFNYSYQCSSSFITSYAPAFVYMSIASVFVQPVLQQTTVWLYGRSLDKTLLHRCLAWSLPSILKPPSVNVPSVDSVYKRSFFGAKSVLVSLFTQLGILLTFGAIFPPVALAMAVSIASIVYLTRAKVQRFVQKAVDAQLLGYLQVINAECAGVGTREQMQLAVKIIVCYCCAFYTLFLFDTLGDTEGLKASAWVLVVVPLLPVGLFGIVCAYSYHATHNEKKVQGELRHGLELTETNASKSVAVQSEEFSVMHKI